VTIAGREVAVIDSGDGGLAVGLARLGAARVTLFDDHPADLVELARKASSLAGLPELPGELEGLGLTGNALPVHGERFDLVLSWGDAGRHHNLVQFFGEIGRVLRPQAHLLLRCPASGTISIDELQHALLAAGLRPILVEADATVARPDLEGQAEPLSSLVARGARLLAYRPAYRQR
jgi:SAM-dependent methyltransferase